MSTSNTEEIYEGILRCSKCGFCQVNCPTYKELWEESACARGRIRLLRAVMDGEQGLSENYVKKLDRCTGCMACTAVCPSGAQPHRLIMVARAHVVENRGLPRMKSLALRNVLASEGLHGLAFSLASRAQRLKLTGLAPGRFVPVGVDLKQFPLAAKPFRDQVPEHNPSPASRERVAFFVGCMIDHSLPCVGQATLRVLRALGVDVLLPRDLKCCGLPLLISGERETAQSLVEHNLTLLHRLEVDRIVTACASCGNALKNEYPELLKKTALADVARTVAEKTVDVCAFLPDRMSQVELGELHMKVTYHDPCHLVRGQGVVAEPRQLIKSVPGVEFQEMNEADRCCGAGGTFQVFFPEVAWGITQRKLDNVHSSGADVVLTACPACLQRLQGGLRQSAMPQTTMHIVELLDQALLVSERGGQSKRDARAAEKVAL